MSNRNNTVSTIAAFVLHSRPYRDTSAIVELFTETHGRVTVVARGVKAAKCRYRGILQPFQPLLVSWVGRGEMFTLSSAEEKSLPFTMVGQRLIIGLYINELLMRAMGRGDSHVALYHCYDKLLGHIASQKTHIISGKEEQVLRLFEMDLLAELGYGLMLDHESETGAMISTEHQYYYHPSRGPVRIDDNSVALSSVEVEISGAALLALRQRELSTPSELRYAKRLLRKALAYHLGDKPLRSRRLFQHYRNTTKLAKLPQHEVNNGN
ncbi:MAG: DNA repair protein RecO [Gammaproteobacteria bacterium]|nr:DNA repair protein RecO [Gammaproteobacteria bacterium]